MKPIFRFISLLSLYRKSILKIFISGLFISFFALIGPWITKILIDNVFPNKDYGLLAFVMILSLSLGIFQSLMGLMRQLFSMVVGMQMSLDIRLKFFGHLQSLPLNFFDSRQAGEILSRYNDADQSLGSTVNLINSGMMNLISLLIFPPILFLINWKLALVGLIILPLDMIIYYRVNKKVRKYSKLIAEKRAEISARNYESISGIRLIKAMTLERKVFERIKNLILEAQSLSVKLGVIQQGSGVIVGILRSLGTFFYTFYGWHQILGGNLTLGSFMAFTNYIGYLYNPIKQFIDMSQDVQQTLVHTNRFFEIYDLKSEIKEDEKAYTLPPVKGEIRFNNITFNYNGTGDILRSLNLEIKAGSTVAIVGRSGIGKTTIANLIPRFYDPTDGFITIDGHNIKDVKLESLRKRIGYVLQDSFLFHGCIRENLILNEISISQDEMEFACKLANAHDFIAGLPQGYDTQIGERGVRLSQGEKQRICLARVLLLNPPILILDEATSSIDLKSENIIQSALESIRCSTTTIVIAHRLSTLREADVIYVLENGTIVEKGNHDELINNGIVYKELYNKEISWREGL